jgi:hypothetical protein
MDHVCHCADLRLTYPVISLSHLCSLRGLRLEPASQRTCRLAGMVRLRSEMIANRTLVLVRLHWCSSFFAPLEDDRPPFGCQDVGHNGTCVWHTRIHLRVSESLRSESNPSAPTQS